MSCLSVPQISMTQAPRKIYYDERTISDDSWAVKHNTQHFHISSKCYSLLCFAVLNAFYCYKEGESHELWKDKCIHENTGLPVSSICNIIGEIWNCMCQSLDCRVCRWKHEHSACLDRTQWPGFVSAGVIMMCCFSWYQQLGVSHRLHDIRCATPNPQ